MSSVVISGDTSGTVSVTVPAVAGTNTVTIPAATGTVMVSGNMPAFSATSASTTTVTANTFTKINIATSVFDTNSNYSTANSRFTPTVAGYYQINGSATILGTTIGLVCIYKNGSRFADGLYGGTAASNPNSNVCCLVYLNGSTDYVELYGLNVSSTSIGGGATTLYFNGAMVMAS